MTRRTERALPRRRIGILGGTFDPIHVGHLALARSARAALALDEVRFVPTGNSWQKSGVVADAAQRLEMVRLAIAGEPGFVADPRESRREGPSYTVDTLAELRAELGPEAALVLLLGSDQLRNLPTWHRWREIVGLAHIACTQRERVSLEHLPPEVEALLGAHGGQALPDAASGAVVLFSMPAVPVSATALRAQLARGERPDGLVPSAVLDYIESRQLYGRSGAPRI
ncbi:MAG TPA: nicotinate-nucleotide adenylyltransferase [Quisquiliibacterium sp.]|nr:nicotinate-nucleotide adenylyltransferase [Quisquiliibacterium sp.]